MWEGSARKVSDGFCLIFCKIPSLNKASSIQTMLLSSEYLYVFYFFSPITSEYQSNQR